MGISVTGLPREHLVSTDYNIITMRQDVRQVARDLGLGLSQQAKIATAISTIARALIATPGRTVVQLSVDQVAQRPAFVISCRFWSADQRDDLAHLEQIIRFDETRVLVDEAALSSEEHRILISLRMWLNR
jgi:anti-sigma regulatory factor (Ser/Thr protein kinase)